MAEIPLRTYVRDIESLINHGRNEEAIAHCMYILSTYPKYVNVYRLLGKALLENHRFGDAADIFQRVLSSVPDDFVSHVGMSIVREDEGNFDEAIWHMERAFEVQPANSAIQDELRRLYGRRDGVEPVKIRLTRGALARMYEKGDLYQQAIAEIRTTIAEDASRLDLQALLAEIYHKTGQVVEAAETASLVMRKLPNCLIPIQVMTQLLTGTERDEDAKSLFKKLIQLDPYSRFASPQSPFSNKIPKNAIRIEKLKWEAGQSEKVGMDQPAWVTSLGVDIESASKSPETVPEWISDITSPEPETEPTEIEIPEEEIPDWMPTADWKPSTSGEEIIQASETIEPARDDQELLSPIPQDEEQVTQADIPDWLKEMAPYETTSIEADTPPTTAELDIPESPLPLSKGMAQEDGKQLQDRIDEKGVEIPDWLMEGEEEPGFEVPTEIESEAITETEVAAEGAVEPVTELPDWHTQGEEEPGIEIPAEIEAEAEVSAEAAAKPASVLLDWLTDDEEEIVSELNKWVAESTEETPEAEVAAEAAAEPVTELPDWLMEGEEESGIEVPSEIKAEAELATEIAAEPVTELPDWLMEGEAEPDIEVPSEIEAEAEVAAEAAAEPVTELPDWLMEGEEEPGIEVPTEIESEAVTETEVAAEGAVEPVTELPDWLMEGGEEPVTEVPTEIEVEAEVAAETAVEPITELPDWLTQGGEEPDIEVPSEIKAEAELATEIAAETVTELPDWLTEGGEEPITEVPLEIETETVAELPDWVMETSEESPDAEVAADAESEPASDLPDWLKASTVSSAGVAGAGVAAVFDEEQEVETTTAPTEKGELPDWLTESEETTRDDVYADDEAEPATELPDWLTELEEPDEPILGDTEPTLIGMQNQESFQEEVTVPDISIDQISSIEPQFKEVDELREPLLDEIMEEGAKPDTVIEDNEIVSSEESGVDTDDLDAAFAWLENLAVKQGADEALILEPEERLETPPDWIQDAMEQTESEYPKVVPESEDIDHEAASETKYETGDASFEARQAIESEHLIIEEGLEQELDEIGDEEIIWSQQSNIPEIESDELVKDAPQDLDDFDAAFSWLESLSVKQDKEETIKAEPQEQDAPTPDWVLNEISSAEEDTTQSKNETEVIEIKEAMELEEAASSEDFQERQDDTLLDDKEENETGDIAAAIVTAELRSLELQQEESLEGEIEFIEKGASIEPEEKPQQTEIVIEEPEAESIDIDETSNVAALLDQMMESDIVTTPEVEFEETPITTSETTPEEYPAEPYPDQFEDSDKIEPLEDVPDLPSWLDEARSNIEEELEWTPPPITVEQYDLNEASLAELEKLPNVGFILAQEIVNFREQKGPFQDVEDLLQIPGLSLATLAGIREFLYIEVLEQVPEVKDEPAPEPSEHIEGTPSELLKARQAFAQSNLENGLEEYNHLIKENIFLAEIITDLKSASKTHTNNFGIWQNLGDAYLRTNQVQDALQAYIIAEELLG